MPRLSSVLLAPLLLSAGCKGCADIDPIQDPPDPVEDDTDRVEDTAPEATADTSVDKPCPFPEVEPNNGPTMATPLPMERLGCGIFDSTVDSDFWAFDMPEDSWLAVDVWAFELGSRADVSVLVNSTETEISAGIFYFQDQPDVHMAFPSGPGRYEALVRQTLGGLSPPGEGEEFFYRIRASSVKAPVSWDVEESANDSRDAAQRLVTAIGDDPTVVFGGIDRSSDADWYEVVVPAGRHRVVVDVDAHAFGSVGDFAVELYPPEGPLVRQRSGRLGFERDPWLEYRTFEQQTLAIKVVEEDGNDGVPYWYALSITVEAE